MSLQPSPIEEQRQIRLLAAVSQGDLPAFESLYREFRPRLWRFLDRLTRQPAMVEELIDDTMLVVWQRAASFNRQSRLSTWIFAIAYRKALKALKYRDEPVDGDGHDQADNAEQQPQQACQQRQVQRQLQQVLASLSPEQRAVVTLTYFHDLPYQEIADIVGCPVDTVKTRMFHARHRLQRLLEGQQEDWL